MLVGWCAILLRTTERVSPVLSIDDENLSSWVEWTEQGHTFRGAPSCPDPTPHVGDPIHYLTTPWPVSGNAWDPDLPWVLAALLGLVVAVGLVRTIVAMVRRGLDDAPALRVAPVRSARTAATTTAGATTAGTTTSAAPRPDLDALVRRAAEDLGWSELAEGPPAQPRWLWWADARRAWSVAPKWPVFVGLVAAGMGLGNADGGGRTALTAALFAVAVVSLAWIGWRFVSSHLALRRTWREPFTSEWVFWSVQDRAGSWLLLLVLGSTPRWAVLLPTRPPLRGTCLVRGELREGGSIHLRIGTSLWLPASPVIRVDEELVTEIADDLRYQLTGEEPAPDAISPGPGA